MYIAVLRKKWIVAILGCVLAVIILITSTLNGGLVSVFGQGKQRKLPIYRVERADNKIAISFDCAWGVDYTDKLLAIMKKHSVKCTFFAVEFWTVKHPEYIKKIADDGHEIGTHSSTHPYMSKLEEKAIEKELSTSSEAIEKVTGKKVELFRPPYGDYDDLLIDKAKEMGLYSIQWDVDSLDWKNLTASEIKKRVVSKVKSGSIVLFHNQGLHTHEALEQIIITLKEKGFEFLPIGELIYRENYYMRADGAQVKLA